MNKFRVIPIRSFVLLIAICVASCARPQSSEPPLSPPTRSVITTPTSTFTSIIPSPTWSPIPTPIPQPGFPSEAVAPEDWSLLPTDLYFLRDASLWRWPKDGQVLDQVVAAPQQSASSSWKLARPVSGPGPTGVTEYRLTPDGRYLVYIFGRDPAIPEPEMVVLDQATGESFPISTATNIEYFSHARLSSFDITPDGRYVVYVAWNVGATTGSKSPGLSRWATSPDTGGVTQGTIFAVDVQDVSQEFELGYCAAQLEVERRLMCDGFVLSPDGARIAFSDARGVWLSEVPQGAPRLIAEHLPRDGFCDVLHVRNWSPDGKHLLIDVGCYEGEYLAVMDVDTGDIREIPHTFVYFDLYVDVAWVQNGASLLVNHINLASGIGPAYLLQVPAQNPAQKTVVISTTLPGDVWPTEPHDLPDGRIGFASQQCMSDEIRAGIYTVGRDGTGLEFTSPLPAIPCPTDIHGTLYPPPILWSPDGTAYLYSVRDTQYSQTNLLFGLSDGSVLWDVREFLANAHTFQWQPPYSGY